MITYNTRQLSYLQHYHTFTAWQVYPKVFKDNGMNMHVVGSKNSNCIEISHRW